MRRTQVAAYALFCLMATGCSSSRNCQVVQEQYVHKYGLEVPRSDWAQRGAHGQVVVTQKDGVVVTKNFEGGQLNGETTYTFAHSRNIEKREIYQNDQLVKEVIHYSTGIPEREIVFHTPTSKTITLWYEDGTPQRIEVFEGDLLIEGQYFTKHNQLESRIDDGEGKKINRDRFGLLVSTDQFKNGQIESRTLYYPNGTPMEIVSYLNGQRHGASKRFLTGGEPELVEHWSQNKREGLTTIYQNGEKFAEIPYTNGKKNGVERRYRNGEEIAEEVSWRDDRQHGPNAFYLGSNKTVEYFIDGRHVTKSQYDKFNRTPSVR